MDRNQKPIAMAYIPWQKWRNIYEPQKALCRGTIFEELDLPFTGHPVQRDQTQKGGRTYECH